MLSRKGWRLLLFLPLLALLSLLGSISPQATAQDSRPNLLAEQSVDGKLPPPPAYSTSRMLTSRRSRPPRGAYARPKPSVIEERLSLSARKLG